MPALSVVADNIDNKYDIADNKANTSNTRLEFLWKLASTNVQFS